jgi:hypothetical protein
MRQPVRQFDVSRADGLRYFPEFSPVAFYKAVYQLLPQFVIVIHLILAFLYAFTRRNPAGFE